MVPDTGSKIRDFFPNMAPTKLFSPPAETKVGTRPGRAVTRELIDSQMHGNALEFKYLN